MSQPISRIRLLVLAVLLVVETALAISLRTSGWVATGSQIRFLVVVVACALPFLMTAILLYRCRVSFRNRQFSLKALMGLTLVVASYLALFTSFANPVTPNTGPLPIAKSVKFDIFIEAATGTSNGPMFTDSNTGELLRVTTPPIVTAADVATVQLKPGDPNQEYGDLLLTLFPIGGNKLRKATAAAKGKRLVIVIDGQVLGTPSIFSPVGHRFRLSVGRFDTEGFKVFRALTVGATEDKAAGTTENTEDKGSGVLD